jgi:hypothetical protein
VTGGALVLARRWSTSRDVTLALINQRASLSASRRVPPGGKWKRENGKYLHRTFATAGKSMNLAIFFFLIILIQSRKLARLEE